MTSDGQQRLLIMRHAEGYRRYQNGQQPGPDPALSASAYEGVLAVADRLAFTLRFQCDPPAEVKLVWYAESVEDRIKQWSAAPLPDTDQARATAQLVVAVLRARGLTVSDPEPCAELNPVDLPPRAASGSRERLSTLATQLTTAMPADAGTTALVVGNQPQVGWLVQQLCGRAVPLARGEIVGLESARVRRGSARRWRLAWTISPSDHQAAADIRDKIKSKMDAAKVLGGFITGLVTFVLTRRLSDKPWPELAHTAQILWLITVGSLLTSAGLYFATLFCYDTLLMPTRFWGERLTRRRPRWLVDRPPSSDAWVLFQNMMRVWTWVFVPATGLVGVGLGALALLAFGADQGFAHLWGVIGAALAITIAVAGYAWFRRPRLGVQD